MRLWEDTLILAFRDLQWRNRIKRFEAEFLGARNNPDAATAALHKLCLGIPPLIKFDGNAESRLSDVLAVNEQDMLVLIEFKAKKSELKTEYIKKKKKLFVFLANLFSNDTGLCPEIIRGMRLACLRAHQVVFWDEMPGLQQLSTMPYVFAMAESVPADTPAAGLITNTSFKPSGTCEIPVGELLSGVAQISLQDDNGNTDHPKRGISQWAMAHYIGWLAAESSPPNGKDGNDDIRAAIVNRSGEVVAYIASYSDLLAISRELFRYDFPPPAPQESMAYTPSGMRARRQSHEKVFAAPVDEWDQEAMAAANEIADELHKLATAEDRESPTKET